MRPLAFVGKLPASKSILNRLLLAQSYEPALSIEGSSTCEDVRLMETAVQALATGEVLQAGHAGTVLRFLALRLSRRPGRHRIQGAERLFARPQQELTRILNQVGVRTAFSADSVEIEGSGWQLQGDTLLVPAGRSSQFASGVLLNAWDLPFDLYVSLEGARVSEGYWRMSVNMAEQLGMKIDFWDSDFRVSKGQKPKAQVFRAETDMSSIFALAAVAAVHGQATFLDFPRQSLQPDAGFVPILQALGARLTYAADHLKVEKATRLQGVAVNLRSSPDLFPVLAALCALAHGESDLFGATQLVYKESNRIERMAGVVRALGREARVKADGLVISGPVARPTATPFQFDCDQDHRLAFAAAVVRAAGWPIEISQPDVVDKSFPEFWDIVGWRP